MGFETPWPDNAIENWGEGGNSSQRELRQPHHQQQLENVNTTQANIHQVTEMEVNGVTGTEEGTQLHRLQTVEVTHQVTQEAKQRALQNLIDEAARGSIEDNAESILNTNSSNNRRSTENNHVNIAQVPEERNENSQIYSTVNFPPNVNISQQPVLSHNRNELNEISQNHFQANLQPNVNTPSWDISPQNQHEFSETLRISLNQVYLADPKAQRTKRNGGARRNIMRNRNNEQIWES